MTLEPTKSTDELMQEAHALVAGGKLKEAEQLLLDVIKRGDKKSNLECFDALSLFAQSRGDLDESIRFALRTLATNKELYGDESSQAVSSMVRLAELYESAGRDEEANDLLYRAKIINDKLVFGEPAPEPEVGSAEQAEQFRSTLKYYAEQKVDDIQTGSAIEEDFEKDLDDKNFVFAEDEPRQEKSGWLMDAIQKSQTKSTEETPPQPNSTKRHAKTEITGAHRFRAEDPKENHRYTSRSGTDSHDQSESRTNVSAVRKDLLNTGSHLQAFAHGKDEIARTLDLSNISWSLKEFVKKRSNIVAVGIGACVFFVLLLVGAYFMPRKLTPLDAYVAMPHVYKSMNGDIRIDLVREDAMQLQQGDTAMTVATSYVVDWRSHLEVLVRSFFEKHFWLKKTDGLLAADDGTLFYTPNNPELLIGDQMQNIAQDANAYFLEHSHYPPEPLLTGYRNIFTRASAKPSLRRLEFLGPDAADVLRQVNTWKEDLANPKEKPRPGVMECFELMVSYPKGKVELFAVRTCKPDQKPQLLISTNGQFSENRTAPLIREGMQIRPRRVWIEVQETNPVDAFCLHHASLIFSLFVSVLVSSSYAFLSLHGTLRRVRFRILFCSLLMVAVYAAGTVLP
ncbi:MAG: tetratricopeptide repeat protein [Cyanobacteria bacterium SZAS-4]|nr:tetratricopeptide repeat protein [Cyanobacteria bacterium SZAS-4]